VTVGKAARGRFVGRLTGLPAGGPYEVELRIVGRDGQAAAQAKVSDVLVGDVWLAAGQSNMQGIGQSDNRLPDDPLVRAFYMNDRWATAREPLHNMWEAIDAVHRDISGGMLPAKAAPGTMISPGVSFAQEMRRRTGVPQGVVACAHGGTTMSQWDPSLAKLGPRSLYGAMMRRLAKNGDTVAGMIWY
jgi:sialate O-acetylesterase